MHGGMMMRMLFACLSVPILNWLEAQFQQAVGRIDSLPA
jgi:hypothetical protein